MGMSFFTMGLILAGLPIYLYIIARIVTIGVLRSKKQFEELTKDDSNDGIDLSNFR